MLYPSPSSTLTEANAGRPKLSADVQCTCRICGKQWMVPDWQKTGTLYCSKEHYDESRRGKPRPNARIDLVAVVCGACGEPFLTGGRGRPRYGSVYCSGRCHGIGQSEQPALKDIPPEQVAWLAGLFDGEGNIAWPRKKNVHQIRLSVTNTCFPLLLKVVEVTGAGSIINTPRADKLKHAQTWNWQCHGENARNLLRIMQPWLIVKAHNASIVLSAVDEWMANGKSSPAFRAQLILGRGPRHVNNTENLLNGL